MLWLLLWVTPARAQSDEPRPRVVVVVEAERAGLGQRLRAELMALGFDVTVEASEAAPDREELAETAREAEAIAAIQVSGQAEGIDVWVTDRVTGKTVLRDVPVPEETDDPDERSALMAIRAVELLRASLLEVASHRPPEGEVASAPVVERVAVQTIAPEAARARLFEPALAKPSRVRIGLGPALGVSPGGVRPLGQLQLGITGLPHPRVALEGFVIAPLFPAALQGPEGLAELTVGHVGASISGRATGAGPIDFRLGAGAALTWLHIEGSAAEPFVASNEDTFVAWPFAQAHLGYVLGSTAAFIDARLGPVVPEPVIRFAEREVVRWGRPAVVVTMGSEIGF